MTRIFEAFIDATQAVRFILPHLRVTECSLAEESARNELLAVMSLALRQSKYKPVKTERVAKVKAEKSAAVPGAPKPSMASVIGEDVNGPYFAFWELNREWPRGSNQMPLRAALAFRDAVDAGHSGEAILAAAKALLAESKYVTRLDSWLAGEGYLAYLRDSPVNTPTPPASFDGLNFDDSF